MKRIFAFLLACLMSCLCISGALAVSDADELLRSAYLLGDKAISRTLHVLYSGYVREEPDESSQIITDVHPDDKVAITGFAMEKVNPLSCWLKIDFYGMEGWVNASRGKIITDPADPYTPGNDPELEAARNRYVGQPMMVNLRSGNARAGVGYNYPTIELVHKYQVYDVEECAFDNDGNLWYQITVDYRTCWIHSGIVDYIGD